MLIVSRLNLFLRLYLNRLSGNGLQDFFYSFILHGVLLYFILLRFPYVYELGFFFFFLFLVVFPLFVCLFYYRVFLSSRSFFASFIPVGTPLWIAPFVCLAETISYIVRPWILIVRPFLNISIGVVLGYSLGSMVCNYSSVLVILLLFLFFYEVFVALVHWFIVCVIISFSIDH